MTAIDALIMSGAAALPVDPAAAARSFGVRIMDYAEVRREFEIDTPEIYRSISHCGFSFRDEGQYMIVLNRGLCRRERRIWTLAHELGHILLGHISDELAPHCEQQERDADHFAAELLAPLCVLNFCGVSSAAELQRLCGLSHQAAQLRFEELTRRRKEQAMHFTSYRRASEDLTAEEIRVCTSESGFLCDEPSQTLFLRFAPFITRYISERSRHDRYEEHLRSAERAMEIVM